MKQLKIISGLINAKNDRKSIEQKYNTFMSDNVGNMTVHGTKYNTVTIPDENGHLNLYCVAYIEYDSGEKTRVPEPVKVQPQTAD